MNSSPFFAPGQRTLVKPCVLTRAVFAPEPLFSLRRRRALCIGFLLVWPAFYASRVQGAPTSTSAVVPRTMRVGKSATLPLASGVKWFIEEGVAAANVDAQNGSLSVRGISPGTLRLRFESSDGTTSRLAFRFVSPDATTPSSPAALSSAFGNPTFLAGNAQQSASPSKGFVRTRSQSQLAPGTSGSGVDPLSQIPPIPSNTGIAPAPASGSPAVGVNPATAPAGFPNGGARVNPPAGFPSGGPRINPPAGFPGGLTDLGPTLPAPSGTSRGTVTSPDDSTPLLPTLPPPASNTALPAAPRPSTRPVPARPATRPQTSPAPTGPQVVRPLPPAPPLQNGNSNSPGTARISPTLPSPSRVRPANVPYRTTPRIPKGMATSGPRSGIEVTQGMARLVSFPENILSVFFSDPNVMDARAINARTIAVTGTGAGTSTLAVFTARYPNDAVGKANIYRVQTVGRGGAANPTLSNDPQVVQAALTAALGDPRVRTSVVRLPDGSLAARLTGTLRNTAEVEGAVSTASFYVGRVLPSLYADPSAPTIDAVLSGPASTTTPEGILQDSLRRLTGNATLELVSLPGGLALKAETNSPEEAEAILRVLPTLGRPVLPFIVLRGQTNTQNPYYQSQALQGEDRLLTERLQAVTGVTTVTAVRASVNSVAIYGTVQTRSDYEAVKRYGGILGQTTTGTVRPTGIEGGLPSYNPAGGYFSPLGVQMFVRILDPNQATIRNVTVETSVVEISRTALRNLGAQYGTASLSNENIAVAPVTGANGQPVIGTNGVPLQQRTVTRTVNPGINVGQATAGNGFAGFGGGGFIDPFRVQLNALEQRGDARVLARPNVSAVEGMPAQITIGGERPVPSAASTTTTVSQNIEFRRFGVIISMRPTVSDDNTILLQIRADITQPDRTFEINLNGALIPGETVRSIDTSIAIRPGDTIIMGGLLTNEKRQQTTKVPILGNLPIIGALFRSKRYENNETELAIFMTPRIDALPATLATQANLNAMPSFPALPSRQESSAVQAQGSVGVRP